MDRAPAAPPGDKLEGSSDCSTSGPHPCQASEPLNGAAAHAPVCHADVLRKTFWHLVPIHWGTILWTYFDRSSLSFAAIALIPDLGLTNYEYGLGAGLFFAGSAVVQVPSVLAGAYVGPPQWLTFLLVAWGAVSAATAAIRSVSAFYVVRTLLGVFESGTFGTIWCHMGLFYAPGEVGVPWAAASTATAISQARPLTRRRASTRLTLSLVLGAPVAAGLLLLDGRGGLRGWQYLFLVLGLATAAYGLVVAAGLARSPASASFLAPAERAHLRARQDAAQRASRRACAASGRWHAPLRLWSVWYLGVAWLLMQATSFAILFWTPLLLDAILSGRFGGGAAPPPPPPRSERDQARRTERRMPLARRVPSITLPCAAF